MVFMRLSIMFKVNNSKEFYILVNEPELKLLANCTFDYNIFFCLNNSKGTLFRVVSLKILDESLFKFINIGVNSFLLFL